jgi:pimeloyl-ACP methyl ester carboxylesterase
VFRFITDALDRCAIRSACRSVRSGNIEASEIDRAEAMLADDGFFPAAVLPRDELAFRGTHQFTFQSRVTTPWPENNVVHGKLYRAGTDWAGKPSVLLVHGWNGELGYYYQFPFIARLLNRSGLNAAMIELPYHARRRPTGNGAINNFISHDLIRMLEATQQAIADLRAVLAWLRAQGSPLVGMWGVSLGAWLTGLVTALDPAVRLAVFMSPLVSLDEAIRELPFCEPIRNSLGGRAFDLRKLNLVSHRPHCAPQGVLIMESLQDLFAPPETVERVWKAWGEPDIWRLRHGHISILASVPMMLRVSHWITGKTKALLTIDTHAATR